MPELTPAYYLSAIDVFRARFKHAVFVLVSDNMEWGIREVIPRVPTAHIFPVGNGKAGSQFDIGVDLATLSQCNHTILSYGKGLLVTLVAGNSLFHCVIYIIFPLLSGTFSFWAGFLAGKESKRIIPSMIFKQKQRVNPLDVKVPPFALTDHGLNYK